MAVSGYVPILLAMLMCAGCQEYSNMLQKSMKSVGISSLQFCLNDEQKSSVALVDPAIPLNLDDGNVSCPAWSVKHNASSKCECGSDLHGKVTCCQNLVSAKMDMLLPCICTVCSVSNAQKTIVI